MHGLRIARYGDPNRVGKWQMADREDCKVEGCDDRPRAKSFCNRHYQQSKKGRILPDVLNCDRCGTKFRRPSKSDPKAVRFCSADCRYEQQLEDFRTDTNGQKTRAAEWRKRHPEVIRANLMKRRALKASRDARSVSERDLLRLIARYGGKCAYCGLEDYSHIDHIVPLSKGGRHALGNLLPACAYCNLSKHARLLADWRYTRGSDRVVI